MTWTRFCCLLFFAIAFPLAGQSGRPALADLAKAVGAQLWMDSWRGVALLRTPNRTLSVDLQTGLALADGEQELQLQPLKASSNGPLLTSEDYARLKDWFSLTSAARSLVPPAAVEVFPRSDAHRRVQVIVLDAGHGGSDPGSLGRHELDGKLVVLREKT